VSDNVTLTQTGEINKYNTSMCMNYMIHAVTLCPSLWIVSSKPAGYFTSSAFRVCVVRSLLEVIFGPHFDAERDGHGGVRWKRRPKNGIEDCRDRGWVARTLLSLREIARGMNMLGMYHHVCIYGLNH